MKTASLFLALALGLQLPACARSDPGKGYWPSYTQYVNQILADHDTAMTEISRVDFAMMMPPVLGARPPMPPDEAAAAIEKSVIPALEKAADKAKGLQTPNSPVLTAFHRPLEGALRDKAAGYKTLVEGFRAKDLRTFESGVKKLAEASGRFDAYRARYHQYLDAGGPPPT